MKIFKYFLFAQMVIIILLGFILQFDHNVLPTGEMIVIFVALLLGFIGIGRNSKKDN